MNNEFKKFLCLLTILGAINLNAMESDSDNDAQDNPIPKVHIMTPGGLHIPVALTPTTTHNDLYRATQASTGATIDNIKLIDAGKAVPKDDNLHVSENPRITAIIKPNVATSALPGTITHDLPVAAPVKAMPVTPPTHKMPTPPAAGITLASGHNTHTSSAVEFIDSLKSLDAQTRTELLEDAVKSLWH